MSGSVDQCEVAVVGAGVVGLAVARALSIAGREVVVLEAADGVGAETSSRNSEVVHAALYYPPGSLKARLCRRGRDLLYAYLAERSIDHLRCEKLVVATAESELAVLRGIESRAKENGVSDIRWISAIEARTLEPEVACLAALLSPSTGIFDSHAYMLSLQGDAEARGALFAFRSRVTAGVLRAGGVELRVEGEATTTRLACRLVVNCAGLGAQPVARSIDGFPPSQVPPLYFSKGCYFSLAGRPPFQRLIYPVPDEASVGLHYLRDLAGRPRFGPDAEWVSAVDYGVENARADRFYSAIRKYWPGLPDGSLHPDYAGVRPKLQAPGEAPKDFSILGPETHGVPGVIHLFGIESPGLTASLAIAEQVAAMAAMSH